MFLSSNSVYSSYLYWSETLNFPYPLASHSTHTVENKIFIVGGAGNSGQVSNVIEGTIDTNTGQIVSWKFSSKPLPITNYWHVGYTLNNKILIAGGTYYPPGVNSRKSVYINEIDNSGDLTEWKKLNDLPIDVEGISLAGSAMVGDYIYFIGGATWTGSYITKRNEKVLFANWKSINDYISWDFTTPLPQPLEGPGVVGVRNSIIVVGGQSPNGPSNKTYIGNVTFDGKILDWMEVNSLPAPIYRPAITSIGDYVFIGGGVSNGTESNKVYYAKVTSENGFEGWNQISPLPGYYCCSSMIISNNYIFNLNGVLSGGFTNKVYISHLKDFISTSPPPSPPIIPNPLVLIPGMGGSWNYEAIVHGRDEKNDKWKGMPYYFKETYGGLLHALEDAGYEKEKNLYIYYYDWRKNITYNALELDSFIKDKVLKDKLENTKVDMVGHSMGGLIARKYNQYFKSENVNKVITSGSPHKGTGMVFRLWEGADYSDMEGLMGPALRTYVNIHNKNYKTNVETIQKSAPSVLDLFPMWDFLKDSGGSLKSAESIHWKNEFIPTLDPLYELSNPGTTTIFGTGHDTIKYIKIEDRNDKDETFGKWIDGKPVSQEYEIGDGAILAASARIPEINFVEELNSNHGELMTKATAQYNLLKSLGIDSSKIKVYPNNNFPGFGKVIVLTVASPVEFSLEDPVGEIYEPDDGFLMLRKPGSGNYKVHLEGVESGDFTIYFGRINDGDEAWEEVSGHIFEDGIATYEFDVDFDSPNLGADPLKNAIERLEDLLQWLSLKNIPGDLKREWLNNIRSLTIQLKENKPPAKDLWVVKKIDQLLQEIQTGKYKKSFNKDVEERITQDLNTVRQDMEQDMEDR